MKTRRMLSMAMAGIMGLSLLAGCGNSSGTGNGSQDTQSSAETEAAAADTSSAASDTGTSQAEGDSEVLEDIAEITMVYMPMGAIPSGLQEVEDAINEITENEINVHVDIQMIESGNYDQQISLMMSSSEKVDLMLTLPIGSSSYNNMANQKQFMDISGLLEEYGQDVLSTVGSLIESTTVDGSIYAVPTYRTLVTSAYIVMRTDVLEDLGLLEKAQNMTSFTEYEEILAAVKSSEKWSYLAGIVNSDVDGLCLPLAGSYLGVDNFSDATSYDQLGDLNKIIAIDPEGSDDTVRMNFDTPEYKAMIDKMRDWYEKGYVYEDAATTDDAAETLIKSNVGFSYFVEGEIGIETSKTAACGMPMTCVKIVTHPISTSSCTKFVWAVPNSSTEPEAAVKFMNMMYTDSRIENLLVWGIEGRDYQVKDGVAYFMDGQDANSVAYQTADFMFGNQFLAYPWDGQSADFREVAKEEMDGAQESKYLGFSCDTTNIQNQLTAIANVISEFGPSLESGIAPEGTYEEFIQKLYDSGAQDIVDEYQRQLDEWLAEQE
ncbi:putative aldouronate transport system substrate-binding protein [Catenibacillus scindens]|uniref:Putative aldouronate transport system substrate-binding protein n=1 Tax=Catenibacillus scindens TaxID=673271 RepID=A0A7W8HBR2_9FIRM|nr:ABC transporter substrate-binding protein [Catenibacillus scindens]MBB5265561.1 putative aldouronate transport system substrate-binding protein [Catenibacillus scindens]